MKIQFLPDNRAFPAGFFAEVAGFSFSRPKHQPGWQFSGLAAPRAWRVLTFAGFQISTSFSPFRQKA
jgi:hypothetical protein